jgi:hypothetical protein
MTTAQSLIQKVLSLPAVKQEEVLTYLQHMESEISKPGQTPLFNPEGVVSSSQGDLSLEDFQQNRREMWGDASDKELQ